MTIQDSLSEIEKFSEDILSVGTPADDKKIHDFENRFQIILPKDYKLLLKTFNGITLFGTEIYGIHPEQGNYALEQVYYFEHFETNNEMPLYLVPFSPDGGGNHYCFDTRNNDEHSYTIVFWQHDYSYSKVDEPEITHNSLGDWIKEVMVDWLLEDYNYDGTEK